VRDNLYLCSVNDKQRKTMKLVKITWDTDNNENVDLPIEVAIPNCIKESEIADWLSDEYGFCVESLVVDRVID